MKKVSLKYFLLMTVVAFLPNYGNAASRYYWERKCLKLMEDNPAQVVISYNFGELSYELNLSSEQIAQKDPSVGKVLSNGEYEGLTLLNQYNNYYVTDSGSIEIGDGYYCTYPIRVKVETGYSKPTVYLANSMKRGTCLFRKTVRHEQQHLDLGYIYLKRYIKELKLKLPKIVKETGPLLSLSNNPEKRLLEIYQTQIDAIYDFYHTEWEKHTAKMDNEENYEKESLLCR